jgi:hypothetical protein
MTGWTDEYLGTEDPNRRYELLRAEAARLRGRRDEIEYYDPGAVRDDVAESSDRVSGDLIAFVANDFGKPMAFRPEDLELAAQNDVRRAILQRKYDGTNDDLNGIRRDLLAEHPNVHKALLAAHSEEGVRYHLPEGSTGGTNFLTVREMVGLIDYTTNSFQSDGLSVTY